jgi:Ice-binding-like
MYAHNVPIRLARAIAPRFAAGVVVTLALLSAACSNDSASRINAPSLLSNSNSVRSSAPSLGAAADFAILSAADGGGGAVTCVGPATITGNVGSSGLRPSVVIPADCILNGTITAPVSAGVVAAFDGAYAALAGEHCTQTITQEAFTDATLSVHSGVICFPNEVTFTRTTLTLTGNGPWLFLIGGSGIGSGALTGTNFNVVMPAGANPCDVTWWVRAGVTMTTSNAAGTHFVGTILAGAAITVTGATIGTFNGRALAKAAVKITGGTFTGCTGGSLGGKGKDKDKEKCNQGVGNGPEGCDPGKSDHHNSSNDEDGGKRGDPGRKGGD